jgi:hypothetical protein
MLLVFSSKEDGFRKYDINKALLIEPNLSHANDLKELMELQLR